MKLPVSLTLAALAVAKLAQAGPIEKHTASNLVIFTELAFFTDDVSWIFLSYKCVMTMRVGGVSRRKSRRKLGRRLRNGQGRSKGVVRRQDFRSMGREMVKTYGAAEASKHHH